MQVTLMRLALSRILFAALVLALALEFFSPFTPLAYAETCTTRGDNLTRNGSVTDGGYDTPHGVVINSWNAFSIGGEWPEYDLADNESANGDIGGSSSQYIHGDGITFDAGIYQVIAGTQPGASYEFTVGWAAMLRDTGGGNNQKIDDVVGRRVGADPTGGTDPKSPNVIWGPEVWNGGRGLNNDGMRVTFKALSNQVTLFARVWNVGNAPSDKMFFDVLCLLPRGDIPVDVIQPSPTPTLPPTQPPPTNAVPPTPRPTRVPPTPTAIPVTPIPAQAFTETPVSVSQRRATATPEPRALIPLVGGTGNTNASGSPDNSGGNPISFAVIAGSVGIIAISLLGMVLIGGFAVWRLFMRQVDDALDPVYNPDDQSHYP
jgi:hypothetical protein